MRTASVAIVALVIAMLAEPAMAQKSRDRYTGFFAAGMSRVSTAELNDRLAATGYPTFGSSPRGIALGAYMRLKSGLMLGGELHNLVVGEKDHAGGDVGLAGGYATLGVGYALELSPRTRVYPRLGLGVGGMGLWREDDSAVPVDFDSAFASPSTGRENTTLSQGSMVVDLGAGAELLLSRRGGGPLLGVRLGYVATPFDQGWTRDGIALSGAPRATVAGPYVRLVAGWRRRP
jgi:hypothetical protein